jgi:hypothetical protein
MAGGASGPGGFAFVAGTFPVMAVCMIFIQRLRAKDAETLLIKKIVFGLVSIFLAIAAGKLVETIYIQQTISAQHGAPPDANSGRR